MSLENMINNIFEEIITEMELPKGSLYIHSNKGKGKETSKSLCISNPEYPKIPHKNSVQTKSAVILNIPIHDKIELVIRNVQFRLLDIPNEATIKDVNSDKEFTHVLFKDESKALYDYIKAHTICSINNYEFSDKFGCCSLYKECSESKRCLHENKLYSKGCYYRNNLELGKVFYGLDQSPL